MRWIFGLVLVVVLAAPLAVHWRWVSLPPAWDPWSPLDIRAEPNLLTGLKLWRLSSDPALCQQALQTSPLDYAQVPERRSAECPIENAVRIQRGDVRFSSSFLATCRLAVAYAMFEQHGLQDAARRVYGQSVTRIDHFGSFACRNIANSNRRSQHATANAFDMAGFRLEDGTRITVARDWNGAPRERQFLREVRDAACRHFNTTLGPDYNRAHHDHFHVDMGRSRICR